MYFMHRCFLRIFGLFQISIEYFHSVLELLQPDFRVTGKALCVFSDDSERLLFDDSQEALFQWV